MLLNVKNLYFGYDDREDLFKNFNLKLDEGKIIALAGESGCGKSTLLSLIYGLLDWNDGEIEFNGRTLLGPKGNLVPGESDMKFVAQNYDLMPYATVYDNVGSNISNIDLDEKRKKVTELLKVVGLEEAADQKPKFLSGGQQQRIAIARALAVLPKLLLLDEPFSNIDFSRKIELRERLFNHVKEHGISLIISTHEIQEVMPWLDQIIVLQEGRLIQNDSPKESYENPYNAYVAKLFGEVNTFTDAECQRLQLTKSIWFPHQITPHPQGIPAQVLESRFAGSHYWNKILLKETVAVMYTNQLQKGEIEVKFLT